MECFSKAFTMSRSVAKAEKLLGGCSNLEEMLSLWKACTWCYRRACGFPDLGPKTLPANLEFLPLIMARRGQKGLRLCVLSALRGSEGMMTLVAGTFPNPN